MIYQDKITSKLNGYVSFIAKSPITGETIYVGEKRNIVVDDAKYSLLHGVTEVNPNFLISSLRLGTDFTDAWVSGTGTLTQTIGNSRILDISGGDFNVIFGTPPQPNPIYIQIGTEYRLVLTWSSTQVTLDQAFSFTVAASSWEWIGNGDSPFTPQSATAVYNETSMDVVFDSDLVPIPYTFTKTYGTITPYVDLSMTIVGQDVIDQNPGKEQIDFTSAALHTGNDNVFSYIRFPRYSISPLIDITILWRLSYT